MPRHMPADYLRAAEAAILLGIAAAAIRWLPLRLVLRSPVCRGAAASAPPTTAACCRIVRATARRVPWRALCFEQGWALHRMLRRRGIASTLRYGVRRRGDEVEAHVWIVVDGVTVLGGGVAGFACLYESPPLPEHA